MFQFRVTVRGRFKDLDDNARSQLLAEAEEHSTMQAAFTEEGTFSYEPNLNAFSFRYVIDDDAGDPTKASANACTDGELRATEYLTERSYGYEGLRSEAMNMSDMKMSTRRLQ